MNSRYQKIIAILYVTSTFVLYLAPNELRVMAQKGNDISITLENTSYVPLNSTTSKVNVWVNYDLENKTLEDQRINGVMKVYSSNGTLIKYSSFPDGFRAKDSGSVEFKTILKEQDLADILVNVTMFDIGKKNILSNTLTLESTSKKPDNES